VSRLLVYVFVTFLIPFNSFSKELEVSDSDISYNLKATNFHPFRDSLNVLSFSDIIEEPIQSIFDVNTVKSTSLGFQPDVYWLKVNIQNTSSATNFVLYNNYAIIDSISVFHQFNNQLITSFHTGDHYSFSTRPINYSGFAFPLKLDQGNHTIYIRIHTTSALKIGFILSPNELFLNTSNKNNLLQGLFYGWLIVMILYNLFLFVTVKEKGFFFMSLMTASNLFMFLITTGVGMQYFWPDIILFNEIGFIFFGSLVGVSSVLFTVSFFELKNNHPFLYKYNVVIGGILTVLLIASFFIGYQYLIKLLMLIVFHNIFFFPTTAIIMHVKGFKGAKLFILAWAIYLFGSLMALSLGMEISLPEGFKSFDYLQIGVALEVLFFSLALGDRINALKTEIGIKEFEKAQISVSLIKKHNIELEKTVRERTQELEDLNVVKDRFFAIISHDLRNSISAFIGIGSLIKWNVKKKSWSGLLDLAKIVDTEAGKLSSFLENLLGWASSQLNKTPYNPENILVLEKTNIILERMKNQIELKKISVNVIIPTNQTVYADSHSYDLILRNLLSNAIKFSFNESVITISSEEKESNVIITVQDTGKGMNQNTIDALFSLTLIQSQKGTQGEQGSGLGLVLVKEILAINKGSISVRSEANKGSVFSIVLPKKQSI
jgi:signal transduction histidine kinase